MDTNKINNMKYVQTGFGRLSLDELPIVRNEELSSKLYKSLGFFTILIIILCIILYMTEWRKSHTIRTPVPMAKLSENVEAAVSASAIQVYNSDKKIYLDNILIRTTDSNIVNIDVLHNTAVTITKYGAGLSYYIDFGNDLEIADITLISDELRFIDHVNIDLLKDSGQDNKKVWEFSNILEKRRDNVIKVCMTKSCEIPTTEQMLELADLDPNRKIVINESSLFLELSEDGDNYALY